MLAVSSDSALALGLWVHGWTVHDVGLKFVVPGGEEGTDSHSKPLRPAFSIAGSHPVLSRAREVNVAAKRGEGE